MRFLNKIIFFALVISVFVLTHNTHAGPAMGPSPTPSPSASPCSNDHQCPENTGFKNNVTSYKGSGKDVEGNLSITFTDPETSCYLEKVWVSCYVTDFQQMGHQDSSFPSSPQTVNACEPHDPNDPSSPPPLTTEYDYPNITCNGEEGGDGECDLKAQKTKSVKVSWDYTVPPIYESPLMSQLTEGSLEALQEVDDCAGSDLVNDWKQRNTHRNRHGELDPYEEIHRICKVYVEDCFGNSKLETVTVRRRRYKRTNLENVSAQVLSSMSACRVWF